MLMHFLAKPGGKFETRLILAEQKHTNPPGASQVVLTVVNILNNSLSDFSSSNHVRKDIWINLQHYGIYSCSSWIFFLPLSD